MAISPIQPIQLKYRIHSRVFQNGDLKLQFLTKATKWLEHLLHPEEFKKVHHHHFRENMFYKHHQALHQQVQILLIGHLLGKLLQKISEI